MVWHEFQFDEKANFAWVIKIKNKAGKDVYVGCQYYYPVQFEEDGITLKDGPID